MDEIEISLEDWLNRLYAAGDGTDTVDGAIGAALDGIKLEYGKYIDIRLPHVPKKEWDTFVSFVEQSEED